MLTRLIVSLVLCAFPSLSWAAIGDPPTLQVACNVASASSPTCTLTGTTTAGRLLVALVVVRTNQTDTGISDPTHGAWTCPAGANHTDTTSKAMVCYLENTTSVTNLVLTLALGGSSVTYWNVTEWSGAMTASSADGTGSEGTDTASPFAAGAGLTTSTAGLIACVSAGNASFTSTTPATGFTALTNSALRDYFQYRVGSATTADCAFTASGPTSTSNAMFAWKEASTTAQTFGFRLRVIQ